MEDNSVNINEMLHDAILKGDVTVLRYLLDRDPLLVHRPYSNTSTIIHIATKLGHLQFVQELLLQNPSLSEELDSTDNSSPLHLASRNGHVDLVKTLISTNSFMCLARDVHGRNPVHVAAMKGHVRVLEELLKAMPAAARERVSTPVVGGGGDTIMHLCVKFNQLEALCMVASTVGDAGMLLNATDGDGNTILHTAVADKQLEIVHFLVNDNRVNKNKTNGNGLTAMDIYVQDNKDGTNNPVLRFTLEQANVLRSEDIEKEKKKERAFDWVENQRSALMVVASLVATMAFQAGLSPPGESRQVENESNIDEYSEYYNRFVVANTIGLVSSMSSIILLISGLPGRRLFVVVVMVMMWVALTSMTYAYGISIEKREVVQFYGIFWVWFLVMGLVFLGHLTITCPRRLNSVRCFSG